MNSGSRASRAVHLPITGSLAPFYVSSLAIALLLAAVSVAGLVYLFSRNVRLSGVLGLVVFSHSVIDWIVHPADLPLFLGGSPKVGLGLWCSGSGLIASIALEFALFVGEIAVYVVYRRRTAREVRGYRA